MRLDRALPPETLRGHKPIMRLWHTKTVWEKLAKEDPYWAVLTDPDKAGNKWQLEEFFATGRETVDRDLETIRKTVTLPEAGRALDFGCGVGRLTQALATHFETVVGVDVAAPMIELAREHNSAGARVEYVHNPASDLAIFPEASFDFVYSVITLQHIPPALIRNYLKEFCRICRPGGVIFFQLPATAPRPKWRFSWYPPTTWMRIKRYLRKKAAIDPEMTMNALKKDEVLAIFAKNGANPLKIESYNAAGDLKSYAYLFQRGHVVTC